MHIRSVSRKFAILVVIWAFAALPLGAAALAQAQDPLPSWNDGPAKQAIFHFVKTTTDPASPKYVAPTERIAAFDQDGTLWVSHPMYTQVVYCLERVPAVVKAKPALAKVEPFKTVLSGNREAMAKLSMKDLEKILVAPYYCYFLYKKNNLFYAQARDHIAIFKAAAPTPTDTH